MTIREKIIENEITATAQRLEALENMGAPAVVIEGTKKNLDALKAGIIKVGGDNKLLDEEYINGEVKKGNGGKQYVHINGCINYFPNAQYGRFIATATK